MKQNHPKDTDAISLARFLSPVILIICLLLTSCQGSPSSTFEADTYPTKTTTPNIVKVTPSPTPMPTVTPTNTPTFSYQSDSKCPEIEDTLSEGSSHGVVSYMTRDFDIDVLLNLENNQKESMPEEIVGWVIVSRNRNNIAYMSTDPKTFKLSLVVRSLDEHKRIEIPWPFEYSLGIPRWQDNSHILFTLRAEDNYDPSDPHPHRNALLNPFTGEITVLKPDFPHISNQYINWNGTSSVVYDATLDYAIYAAWEEAKDKHEYILWHIPSQTELASLPGNSYGGYTADHAGLHPLDGVAYNSPVWSSDDTQVAVISFSPNNVKVDEIFALTKSGNVQQLTQFSSQYEAANVRSLSWSPDGEELAFFVKTYSSADEIKRNEQLAILNTQTGNVSLYCLNGDMIGTRALGFIGDEEQVPAPVWSPDGNQLIIENRFTETESHLVLLDIPRNTAYVVGQNMQPVGWMLSEP